MITLALASLRHRALASLAAFVAVLLGAGLLVACGGLFETAIRLDAPPQRLGGAPLMLTGPGGFRLPGQESQTVAYSERPGVDAGLVSRIAAIPGVARAVPDVSFAAVVAGVGPAGAGGETARADGVEPGDLSGHSWESAALTPYALQTGRAPDARGEVVLDAGTAARVAAEPGEQVVVTVAGKPNRFTVTGIADAKRRVDVSAVFFSTVDAHRLASRAVDSVGVLLEPGAPVETVREAITKVLPSDYTVLAGRDRGVAEFLGVGASRLPLILLASIFGGMVAVVMALVVSATISLTVQQRRRELALLRASGASPRQVYRAVVVETAVVAGVAAACGVDLGRVAGDWIFTESAERGLVPGALDFQLGVVPLAAGGVAAFVAALAAVAVAARPAAEAKPIQALAEAAIPAAQVGPVRRVLAAVFGIGTVGLAVTTVFLGPETAAAVGGPAVLTGGVAVALAGPELVVLLLARSARVVERLTGRSGILAVINGRARAVQVAAVLTPLTLGVAIALGNLYSQSTLDHSAVSAYTDRLAADAVVTPAAGGVSPALRQRVLGTDGVALASALVTSHGWIENPYDSKGSDPGTLVGIDADTRGGMSALSVPVAAGSLRGLSGNAVAVPEREAAALGIDLGDRITMRLGDGARVEVKVVALLDTGADYPIRVLPADLLAPHTTAGRPTGILVRAEPGQDRSALVDAIETRLRDWPGTRVGERETLAAGFTAGLGVQAWINYLIAVLAIAYAAVASVNTIAVAVLSRRQEFALQRLAGATRRQVQRMLLVEGAIVAVASLMTGTAIAAFTVVPTAFAVGDLLPSGRVWVLLAVIATVFLIVWPVTAVSGRIAMRHRAIETIGTPAG